MALSKPIHIDELIGIISSKEQLFDFLRKNNALFDFDLDCKCCGNGRLHLRCEKAALSDGFAWRCTNKHCNNRISFRKHSFFSGSHLSIA